MIFMLKTEILYGLTLILLVATDAVIFANSLNQDQVTHSAVILLLAHPASFAHDFVSGMQNFHFSESQDAIVLQTSH